MKINQYSSLKPSNSTVFKGFYPKNERIMLAGKDVFDNLQYTLTPKENELLTPIAELANYFEIFIDSYKPGRLKIIVGKTGSNYLDPVDFNARGFENKDCFKKALENCVTNLCDKV